MPINYSHIPLNAYRLQFSPFFTFKDAIALLDYLKELGIDTLYCSPFMQNVVGSSNFYAITHTHKINKSLGGLEEYERFCERLEEKGLFQIVDLVPNHMAAHEENPWFYDLLKKGKDSKYQDYFDIFWDSPFTELKNKILLPILPKSLQECIEEGYIRIEADKLRVGEKFLPIYSNAANIGEVIDKAPYVLAEYTLAAEKTNYRRFFEISDLIAIRMENPKVFDEMHRFVFDLIAEGKVQGLRIDHPDGLKDPEGYFEKLYKRIGDLYVVIEKIVKNDEPIEPKWKVHGSVGYEVMHYLAGIFIDDSQEKEMTRVYERFIQRPFDPQSELCECKKLIAKDYIRGEISVLADKIFKYLSKKNREHLSFSQIRKALYHLMSYFPVYRSYLSHTSQSEEAKKHLQWAFAEAFNNSDASLVKALSALKELFLPQQVYGSEQINFMMQMQQLLPCVMAKGFEDTFLYRYNRLLALNDVGFTPTRYGIDLTSFHKFMIEKRQKHPLGMLSSSTHDTKRSEDARYRLCALSEDPIFWEREIHAWSKINESLLGGLDKNVEYFFYQTLLSIWPLKEPSDSERASIIDRLQKYMLKANREAKVHSNWVHPNQIFEDNMHRFISRVINHEPFMQMFVPYCSKLAVSGYYTSLSATNIKLALPGVFDLYQGLEIFCPLLVDPDNRRPINFEYRKNLLKNLPTKPKLEDLQNEDPNLFKLYVLKQGLQARKKHKKLFLEGQYLPLEVIGKQKEHIVAFMRKDDKTSCISLSQRFFFDGCKKLDDELCAVLPANMKDGSYEDLYTKNVITAKNSKIYIAKAFANYPFALLLSR